MPRNACLECRLRKVKCVVNDLETSCSRCLARQVSCSYSGPAEIGWSSIPAQHQLELEDTVCLEQTGPVGYKLLHSADGLDIGHGSPAEILREGDLTQPLLLLYFSNFCDVHFMFDQDQFMRKLALGEVPKMVLYAMMALGIRYSQVPFKDSVSRAHRGELLYRQARELLKQEFDYPSLTTAHTYVLLSTYHLTFGGSRKAWVYLNYAYSIVQSLRLIDAPLEIDPRQAQLSRQLIGTIYMMDRTISPCLKMNAVIPNDEIVSDICARNGFPAPERSGLDASKSASLTIFQHLVSLSTIYSQLCVFFRYGQGDLPHLRACLERWTGELPDILQNTPQKLESHYDPIHLRQLLFLHVLLHHTHQLSLFPNLGGQANSGPWQQTCYDHASSIIDLVEWMWDHTGTDLHNPIVAQCLTIAAVVQTHSLLTASTFQTIKASQDRVSSVRRYFSRVKQHCRLFTMTLVQLETFLKICSVDCSANIFNQNKALLNQMLHLGTSFERLDYRTAGRVDGLGNLVLRSQNIVSQYKSGDPTKLLSPEFLTQRMNNITFEQEVNRTLAFNFDDYAWIFTDMSFTDDNFMGFG